MPVDVRKMNGKYRIVDGGKVSKTHLGNPRDGGGHSSIEKAQRQAGHINKGIETRKEREAADRHKKRYGRR